ncbi:MAG: endolytic transglycosylase MltG [Dehalococcoidia bacterium]|nr:endolytic transglycosylase MltG [Dehalococcoidia bacterium]
MQDLLSKRTMNLLIYFTFLCYLVLAYLVMNYFFSNQNYVHSIREVQDNMQDSQIVELNIVPGDNSNDIYRKIDALDISIDTDKFAFFVSIYDVGSKLQAGKYKIANNQIPLSLMYLLLEGPIPTDLVTFPEGLRIEEIGNILVDNEIIEYDEWEKFMEESIDHTLVDLIGIASNSELNGYLMPASYDIDSSDSLDKIILLMLNELESRILDKYESLNIASFNDQNLSLKEIIILASMIERESVLIEEQPIISSVLRNRLKKNMLLQSDPTVQYAITSKTSVRKYGWWKQNLTYEDLDQDSAYNTYVYKGLPIAPIANPGFNAIIAAMEPAETDFIFFVASEKCDGSHRFSETLKEHNNWVAQYEKNCT